jgi:hypothetical protein
MTAAEHGTDSRYTNQRCRCVPCTDAHAVYMRDLRADHYARTAANGGIAPVDAHNRHTYSNWGCHCPDCTEDHRLGRISQRAARAPS